MICKCTSFHKDTQVCKYTWYEFQAITYSWEFEIVMNVFVHYISCIHYSVLPDHSVEISRFFRHSDFPWNQFFENLEGLKLLFLTILGCWILFKRGASETAAGCLASVAAKVVKTAIEIHTFMRVKKITGGKFGTFWCDFMRLQNFVL